MTQFPILVEAVGFLAAALTTFAFAPQAWRTWRTRSTGDLSLAMLGAQSSGCALWLVYALATGAAPLALANGITFLLVASLVVLKLAERGIPAAAEAAAETEAGSRAIH